MQLQINSSRSATPQAIETQIRHRVDELENYVNSLQGCTKCLRHLRFIVIEKAGRIRVHLDLPGEEITIDRQNSADLLSAIDETFAATRAKLEEYVHKLRHDVKTQESSPDVRVTTIFPPKGYGLLETSDGREINFAC
jgi:ribosome-associated translation inhibitor RaiA